MRHGCYGVPKLLNSDNGMLFDLILFTHLFVPNHILLQIFEGVAISFIRSLVHLTCRDFALSICTLPALTPGTR